MMIYSQYYVEFGSKSLDLVAKRWYIELSVISDWGRQWCKKNWHPPRPKGWGFLGENVMENVTTHQFSYK